MDKNTISGLVLMAAVIFAFMWINSPSEEEKKAHRDAIEQQEAMQQQKDKDAAAKAVNLLSAEEKQRVEPTVRTYGTPDPARPGVTVLSRPDVRIAYNAADSSLTGTVTVEGQQVDVNKILSGNLIDYTPEVADRACGKLRSTVTELNKYKSFAQFLDGKNETVVLENDQMSVTVGTRGGCVQQVVLKKYKTETTSPATDVMLFDEQTSRFNMMLTTTEQHINTADLNFRIVAANDSSVTMGLPLGEGIDWQIRYTLVPDIYIVKMEVIQKGVAQVIPSTTTTIGIDWSQNMMRNELGRTFEERNSMVSYKFADETPKDMENMEDDTEQLNGRIKWVAFKNQFFTSVMIPRRYLSSADLESKVIKNSPKFLKDMTMHATLPYSSADGSPLAFDWYFGPNLYPLLSSLDDELSTDGENLDLNRLVPLGYWWYSWINRWVIIPVFTFLSKYISNYGIIILLLTVFIKIVIFPFTYKSYVSQAKMRILAPEIKAINEKYPGQENAMKRQQETMALYSRAGASPFSGCLPMLLQMPILIAMFSFFPSAIELRGQSFLWAHDLSAPDSILTLPFSIPWYGNHVSLFCLLMTIVNVVYTRITMASQPGNSEMPGMKWMMYLMPVMFLFFFNDYASALSYYYLLSLLITIIQTYVIRHWVIKEDKVRAQMEANAKKPRKKSGFMARLEAAQKQQEAYMRQQQKQAAKKRR